MRIMKKLLFTMVLAAMCATSAFAQFEKGKWYTGASLAGAGLSYSKLTDLELNLAANAGYTLMDNFMVIAETGFDYSNSEWSGVYFGAKGRYYMEQNGIFFGAGVRYMHMTKGVNDVQLTPEVGYCFFLNRHVSLEPCVFYDMSLSEFADYSKFGVKIGLGVYF